MQSDAIRCHQWNSPSLRKLDDPPLRRAHARPHTAGWLPLQPLASSAASASPRAPASLGRAAAHSERGPAYVIRGHQRSSEVIRGPQRSSEVISCVPAAHSARGPAHGRPRARHGHSQAPQPHLMKGAISMQSACNQHAISMQSRTLASPSAPPDEGGHQHVLRDAISMHSACCTLESASNPPLSMHAISMQSACNQHAISTQSACNQHAISMQSACSTLESASNPPDEGCNQM